MTKRLILCTAFIAAMLICAAYADEDPDIIQEDIENVEDDTEYQSPDPTSPPSPISISGLDDPAGDPGGMADNVEQDITPVPESTIKPAAIETPEPTHRILTMLPEAYAEESPEPSPEEETEKQDDELDAMDILTRIYGCLIFFVVVVLCYFAYKFFSMLFPI